MSGPDIHTIYRTHADDIPVIAMTKTCIILDLDLTLISTQDSIDSLYDLKIMSDPNLLELRRRTYHLTIDYVEKNEPPSIYHFWGVTRPYLEDFLKFCFSYFNIVAVWSAGTRPYVEAIVDHIFKDLYPIKPHIVFTRDDCVKNAKGKYEKPLIKMIESHPILQQHMTLENSLALDDTPVTFKQNPDNGVQIPAYEPELTIEALSEDDDTLLRLKNWLLRHDVIHSPVHILNKEEVFI